jgi:hypothetical protein
MYPKGKSKDPDSILNVSWMKYRKIKKEQEELNPVQSYSKDIMIQLRPDTATSSNSKSPRQKHIKN